jgi:hypothetical protein
MKNISKNISILFLSFSILLLCYVFYRSELHHEGTRFSYYLKYYIISFVFVIISIFSFFIRKEIKVNTLIVIFSFFFCLYLLEALILIQQPNYIKINIKKKFPGIAHKELKKKYNEYDKRTKLQIYKDLNKEDKNVSVTIYPADFVKNTSQIFRLSGISNSKTIYCNENGYTVVYQSDRHGFNNPNTEWDKSQIEYLLIGDSFTHGACVNEENTISGNIRRMIKEKEEKGGVLNLGYSNNGPLLELATLREYLPHIYPKKVLWIYFEKNDLFDLNNELTNETLLNYLNDNNFSKKLYYRQNEIDLKLSLILSKKIQEHQRLEQSKIIKFIKLYEVRTLSIEKLYKIFFVPRDPNNVITSTTLKKFSRILSTSKELAEKYGAKFYFVSLPNYNWYLKNEKLKYESYDKDKKDIFSDLKNMDVTKIVKNLNIPIIDMEIELFQKHEDPLSLLPFRSMGHYNNLGYKLIAKTIIRKINELEK